MKILGIEALLKLKGKKADVMAAKPNWLFILRDLSYFLLLLSLFSLYGCSLTKQNYYFRLLEGIIDKILHY